MSKVEEAVSTFLKGFVCSQAVLSAFAPDYGLNQEFALKLGSPFGAGIGRMGETCGALSGAYMVLGLKYGWTELNTREKQEQTYRVVKELTWRFKERCGSTLCRDILGLDISTPEGLKQAREKNLFASVCTGAVRDAALILDEIVSR